MRRWLAQNGVDSDTSYDVLLATGEACSNAIQHAYGATGGDLKLEGTVESGNVTVVVTDHGAWREPRPLGDNAGRGMAVMKQTMDSLDVTTTAVGTRVVLRTRFPKRTVDA